MAGLLRGILNFLTLFHYSELVKGPDLGLEKGSKTQMLRHAQGENHFPLLLKEGLGVVDITPP